MRQVGVRFEIVVPRISEGSCQRGDSVESLAEEIALEKARSVSLGRPGRIVVGADTLVLCDGEVLGKPGTRAEATGMLEKLSGRDHHVVTGVSLCRTEDGEVESARECERTVVTFRRLGKREIGAYVASGEPMDKAGGYGIQGKGALLIERIVGCYFNVVGLPLARLYEMLRRWECELLG